MGSSQHRLARSPLLSESDVPHPAGGRPQPSLLRVPGPLSAPPASPRVVTGEMKTTADHRGHQRAGLSTPFCAGPLPAVWAPPQSTYLEGPGLHPGLHHRPAASSSAFPWAFLHSQSPSWAWRQRVKSVVGSGWVGPSRAFVYQPFSRPGPSCDSLPSLMSILCTKF